MYYLQHKDKLLEKGKLWRTQNAERVKAYRARYKKKPTVFQDRCINCESLLKQQETVCNWCIDTYGLIKGCQGTMNT